MFDRIKSGAQDFLILMALLSFSLGSVFIIAAFLVTIAMAQFPGPVWWAWIVRLTLLGASLLIFMGVMNRK